MFKEYRRTAIAEMMPWQEGFDMKNISVSEEDKRLDHLKTVI